MLNMVFRFNLNKTMQLTMFSTRRMVAAHSTVQWRVALRTGGSCGFATQAEITKYKTDTETLAKWLDVSAIKVKGRVQPADTVLLSRNTASRFPTVKVQGLNGIEVTVPGQIEGKVKLVVFSFKDFGFDVSKSWSDPFIRRFLRNNADATNNPVAIYRICFVEHKFLSILKTVFINNLSKDMTPRDLDSTGLVFGGVMDFAAQLLLPNVYTGYAYLLDSHNQVRWQGCGEALPEEVETMIKCTEELLGETEN